MLSVLLIWIYIIGVTFGVGVPLLYLSKKIIGYESKDPVVVMLTGFVCVTVYSQFASLFGGVGLIANIILLCGIATCVFLLKKEYSEFIKSYIDALSKKENRVINICYLIIFLVMAYGASHGIMHYDTGLYHAQAIRWIEEYGIVPGLGNLHCRLGYNSAAFPVTALFSFSFLGGQSYHVVSGFCALLLALDIVKVYKYNLLPKRITISLFARFMGLYYLLIIFDEMVSPASDYYMVTTAFVFFIKLLDAVEDYYLEKTDGKDESDQILVGKLAMLSFLACMILTIKLSGGLMILLAIIPGAYFVKNKKVKELVISIVTGTVIVVPYLIRNVIISGWLLYPSTGIDLFNVDWKIPKDSAMYDYKEIQVYGRGFTDVGRYNDSIRIWFVDWLKQQTSLDRLFVCIAIVGVCYFVVKCLYYGFSLCICKKRAGLGLEVFTEMLIVISFMFWLFTSPLMRYGCLYVYLVNAIVWGTMIKHLSLKLPLYRVVTIALLLVLAYKGAMFGTEVVGCFRTDCFIKQQDYSNFPVSDYEVDGVKIYMPVSGDQTGYDAFPSSPWQMDIMLRGTTIGDGFKLK